MKKWFVVLCLSFVSVVAFAQRDPHAGAQEKFLQESQPVVMGEISTHSDLERFHNMESAVERKVAQVKVQEVQQPQTSLTDEDGHKDVQQVAVQSDRPSYYAQEEAYKNCKGVDICNEWAQEQAQDVHFQVLSASLSMPDYHNQRLEVRYVSNVEEKVQVFEEYFGSWKQVK